MLRNIECGGDMNTIQGSSISSYGIFKTIKKHEKP